MKAKKLKSLKNQMNFEAPMFSASIPAGLDQVNKQGGNVNLNKMLVSSPGSMYLVRVNGESMIDENIFDGDMLIVDRDEEPADGKVVISSLNGEMTVKTFREIDGKVYLYSANKQFLPIEIMPFWQFEIQGVVKHVIHKV